MGERRKEIEMPIPNPVVIMIDNKLTQIESALKEDNYEISDIVGYLIDIESCIKKLRYWGDPEKTKSMDDEYLYLMERALKDLITIQNEIQTILQIKKLHSR